MKRWSKLKKRVENLLNPEVKIYCEVYRMKSQRGSTDMPIWYLTVSGEKVWEYSPGEGYPYEVDLISNQLNLYCNSKYKSIKDPDRTELIAALELHDRRKNK